MFAKSISRRWFVNTIGVVLVVLVIFVAALSFMVQSSTYNGIESTLTGRMDELLNLRVHCGYKGLYRDLPG